MKSNIKIAMAWCDRVVVWLEGPLEVVDSLAGMCSKATHQAEVRMLVQPSREMFVTMIGDCQSQKYIEGGARARGLWHLR
jgi:hypothetical protein